MTHPTQQPGWELKNQANMLAASISAGNKSVQLRRELDECLEKLDELFPDYSCTVLKGIERVLRSRQSPAAAQSTRLGT